MKQCNSSFFLFLLLLTLMACSKPQMEELRSEEDNSGIFFLVTNLTGHTFPENENVCGDPLSLTFELKSDIEIKEITISADNMGLMTLKIEEKQQISVRVWSEDGSIIAQNTNVFTDIPQSQKTSAGYHRITFCGNTIDFNF